MANRSCGEMYGGGSILRKKYGETVLDSYGKIFYQEADGKLYRASAKKEYPKTGVLLLCMGANAYFDGYTNVLANGRMECDDWAWEVGKPIFISTVPGALTQEAPPPEHSARIVGTATKTNQIEFKPGFHNDGQLTVDVEIAGLSPSEGDVLSFGSSEWETLGAGGEDQKLTIVSGVPGWKYNFDSISPPLRGTINETYASCAVGTGKFWSGVGGKDGLIYLIPFNYGRVGTFDPLTGTVDLDRFAAHGVGTNAWVGGVLAPNGKIYCVPYSATSVLIIDPSMNTIDTTTISGLTGTGKYCGGVLAPNGKIYCIPFNATTVLIIDPETDTAENTSITGLVGSYKWWGGVLGPNGKIYGIPRDSESVLIIDPSNNTADTTTIAGITGTFKYYGGALAPNGKIYCCPYGNFHILVIDPATDTKSYINKVSGSFQWMGAALAQDGYIYTAAYGAFAYILCIRPDLNDYTTISPLSTATSKFGSIVAGVDGNLYLVPMSAPDIGKVYPKETKKYPLSAILSPYLNKAF